MNITIQRLKINIVENFSWFRSKSRSIQKKKEPFIERYNSRIILRAYVQVDQTTYIYIASSMK